MKSRSVMRLLIVGVVIQLVALGPTGISAPARAGQGSGTTVYLPFTSSPPPPIGACKHLETVPAWQMTVDVVWSDAEGPTERSPNGYPQTFNASGQQTVHAVSEVPLSSEQIFDPVTNVPVGRVFKHPLVNGGFQTGAVTGTNAFTADESIYTPPDGAGGGNTTVRYHYTSNGPFVDSAPTDVGLAKVTVFGNTCKLNLDLRTGKVNLEITIDGTVYTSQPSVVGSLVLRQIAMQPSGLVNGQARVVPNENRVPGSPFDADPPVLDLMASRTQIRAWREGGPFRAAQVTWRLAPVTN